MRSTPNLLGGNTHVGQMCISGIAPRAVVPFTASDNFSGVYPNSGSVGDANWDARWSTSETGTITRNISGGALTLTGSTLNCANTNTIVKTISGDFTATVNYDNLSLPASTEWLFGLVLIHSTGIGYSYLTRAYSGSQKWLGALSTGGKPAGADSANTGSLEIQRVGSTMTLRTQGIDRTTDTVPSDITEIRVQIWSSSGTGSATVDVLDFTLVDGSGDPILI